MASSAATGNMGKKLPQTNQQSAVGSSLGKVMDEGRLGGECAISEEEEQAQKDREEEKNKLWMDFDDFSVCFKSIIVYHKPNSFKFNEKYSDLRVSRLLKNIKNIDSKKILLYSKLTSGYIETIQQK